MKMGVVFSWSLWYNVEVRVSTRLAREKQYLLHGGVLHRMKKALKITGKILLGILITVVAAIIILLVVRIFISCEIFQ